MNIRVDWQMTIGFNTARCFVLIYSLSIGTRLHAHLRLFNDNRVEHYGLARIMTSLPCRLTGPCQLS